MVLASSSGALNEVVRPGSTLSLSDAQLESRVRTVFFRSPEGTGLNHCRCQGRAQVLCGQCCSWVPCGASSGWHGSGKGDPV